MFFNENISKTFHKCQTYSFKNLNNIITSFINALMKLKNFKILLICH